MNDNLSKAIEWAELPVWAEKYADAKLLAGVASAALQEVLELRKQCPMGAPDGPTPLDTALAKLFPDTGD
jgi:hypothetical protein